MNTRTCQAPNCDVELVGRVSKKFCSTACKNAVHKPKTTFSKICLICNKEFTSTNSLNVCCSAECKDERKLRLNRANNNEITMLVKNLQAELLEFANVDEQEYFCLTLLDKAKSDIKLRRALTSPIHSAFKQIKGTMIDQVEMMPSRPRRHIGKRFAVFFHDTYILNEDGKIIELDDVVIRIYQEPLPRLPFSTFVGPYKTEEEAIKMRDKIQAIKDSGDLRWDVISYNIYVDNMKDATIL